MKTFFMKACFVLGMVVSVSVSVQASVTANYGDFVGSTITYIDVSESADFGMYRAPIVSDDTLSFNPLGLKAETSGAGGVQINDAQLAFGIQASSGNFISDLQFNEAGDFTMIGVGTDATMVDVTANFIVSIFEVDGNPINTVTTAHSMTFSLNSDGTFSLLTGGGGGFNYQDIWSGIMNIDVERILTDNGIDFVNGATQINVNRDTILTASSEAGTAAQIQKKSLNGLSITVIADPSSVPEPSSVVLLGTVSSMLLFVRYRFPPSTFSTSI